MPSSSRSNARKTLQRQVAFIFGALSLLWLGFGLVAALAPVPRAPSAGAFAGALPMSLALLGLTAISWRLGVRAVDRLVGPTLDRLAQVAQQTAPLDPLTGLRLPSLWSESPRTALGQLASRLEEAQVGLRGQVEQLSRLNRELARTREELLRTERLAVVGRLAAGVAHEIGNPLGALIGFVALAKGTDDPPTRQEAVAGIDVQAQRIHRTLQELMDFSRAGKIELLPTRVGASVQAAERLVRAHPRWREMGLAVDVPETLPPAQASEHHLVQVLANLLLNAADACEGRGKVTIALAPLSQGRLRLTVADDGPGISAAEAEHIFEPFVSTKPTGQGTGLGLAISRQIVEAFGGTIRAMPEGPGARFEIELLTLAEPTNEESAP